MSEFKKVKDKAKELYGDKAITSELFLNVLKQQIDELSEKVAKIEKKIGGVK